MLAAPLFGAASLAASVGAFAACTGPGAPSNTETKCKTAVAIPGNPIRSFDISWVNPDRAEYYLGERSNKGIVVIDTRTLTWKRTIGGFVGILPATGAVNNNISGPDGVTSHGRWLYAGDGDSTLHVIDLDAPDATATKDKIPTGGATRVDEMALTTDGELLLAANNAEDPPFATLFRANGDRSTNSTMILTKVTIDPAIVPAGAGLSMEQPTWEAKTRRFYVSVPLIANNPAGCTFDNSNGIQCQGGMAVIDPTTLTMGTATIGAFNPTTNTGVVPLSDCGPNGITVGPHSNMMLGCTPQNVPSNTTTQVINAVTKNFVEVGGLTGSDEVWYNSGDNRYYTGSSRACGKAAGCNPPAGSRAPAGAALGVVNARTNFLIEKIPASSNSHSVAADSKRNLIFVPQVAPNTVVLGGDSTDVGAGVCGTNNGCVAVYSHQVRDGDDHDDGDHDGDDHDHGHDH
jgi:hypothetical protein